MVHVCDGLSYVERGTDEARDGEGFLETPLPYDEACKVEELFERLERAETTLRAVHENATNHHSGEDGKARALYVIGNWTAEVLHGRIHRDAALVGRSDS